MVKIRYIVQLILLFYSVTNTYHQIQYMVFTHTDTQTWMHQRLQESLLNIYSRAQTPYATELVALQQQRSLAILNTITRQEYAALAQRSVTQWQQLFKQEYENICRDARARNEHLPNTYSKEFQKYCMELYGLYTLPNFVQAIKEFPQYHQIIVAINQEIKHSSELQRQLQEAMHNTQELNNKSLIKQVVAIFQPPVKNIQEYIRAEAETSQKVILEQWNLQQKKGIEICFAQRKIPQLQQECRNLMKELVTTNPTLKPLYQSLHALARKTSNNLPQAAGAPLTANKTDITNVVKVNLPKVEGFIAEPTITIDRSYCFGNQIQHDIHAYIINAIKKAEANYKNANQIADINLRAHVQETATAAKDHALQALDALRAHNIPGTLRSLKASCELQAHAQDIQKSQTLALTTPIIKELKVTIDKDYQLVFDQYGKSDSAAKAVPVSIKKAADHHNAMILQRAQTIRRMQNALHRLEQGTYNIQSKTYILTPEAQKLLINAKIPLSAFTHCIGNEYVQARHEISVNLINQSAALQQRHASNPLFSQGALIVVDFTHKGSKALNRGDIQTTMTYDAMSQAIFDTLSSYSLYLLDPALAITNSLLNNQQMIERLAQGAIQGAVTVIHDAYTIISDPEQVIQSILNTSVNIGQLLTVLDDTSLVRLPQHEYVAIVQATTENIEKAFTAMGHKLSHLATLSPQELQNALAYQSGYFWSQALVCDGIFRACATTVNLAKTAALKTLPQAQARMASAIAHFEQTVAQQELNILSILQKEKKIAQAAGTQLDLPLLHFNEQLVQKAGPENVAAKVPELEKAAQKVPVATFNITEALKDIPAACAKLDPSLGNVKKIEEMVVALKDVPGAIKCPNGEGPVLKLLKGIHSSNGGTIKGALYELEVAHEMLLKGEKISLGERLRHNFSAKDFDIVTSTKLIECKAVNWQLCDKKKISEIIGTLKEQANIAKSVNKDFILFSKYKLSNNMKNELLKHKISFWESELL